MSDDFPVSLAFDLAPVALIGVDADGRLRAANERARTLLGLRDRDLEGPWGTPTALGWVFPGAEVARLRTLVGQALLHRREERAELGLIPAEGEPQRVAVAVAGLAEAGLAVAALRPAASAEGSVPAGLPGGPGAAGPGTGLREGLERYRRLFTANRDAVLVLDANSHVVVEANHAAVQLAGRPDLVGLPSAELVAPAHRGTWTMAVTGAAASSSIAPDLEVDLQKDDGSTVPAAVQLDGLVLGDGRVVVANLRRQPSTKPARPRRSRGGDGVATTKPLVLVVDDDDGARRAAQRLLGRLGFDTVEARDGAEALDQVAERGDGLALVLLDVVMPGVDGLTAYARIKRLRESLPVILCSGYDELDRLEGVSLGTHTRFLPKPFDLGGLRERVRALFEPAPSATSSRGA